jgi:hypothetical protein
MHFLDILRHVSTCFSQYLSDGLNTSSRTLHFLHRERAVPLGSTDNTEAVMHQNPQRYRHSPHDKHRCLECARYRSVFVFRGRVRADADHNLCPRCYRSHRQRLFNWFAASSEPRLAREVGRGVAEGGESEMMTFRTTRAAVRQAQSPSSPAPPGPTSPAPRCSTTASG